MTGPHPQYPDAALSEPNYQAAAVYPGTLPPPVDYPHRSRWRIVAIVCVALAIVAGTTTAILYSVNATARQTSGELSAASTKTAIQTYLNALVDGDTETVARNTSCGFYEAVKDRRSDQVLARLSSDTFRKQFAKVDVTTIDKIVYLSPTQANVLFTMQVVPLTRNSQKTEEQAVAQVLSHDNQLLVCQYVLRAVGQF